MIKSIFATLVGMLLLLTVMFVSLFMSTRDPFANSELKDAPKYHIQVIVQNSDEKFWEKLKEGAEVAAKELNVFVEFVPIAQEETALVSAAVEKGVLAEVDAIVLQAINDDIVELINKVSENGTKMVTYENFAYNSLNVPIIGSNNYEIGNHAGKMAVEATDGNARVALILNDSNNLGGNNNFIVQGTLQAFSLYSSINLEPENIYTLDTGMFETETIVSRILTHAKDIDLIICTDDNITPRVAQMVIDQGLVKDIKIIGYGGSEQTLDYIKRGTIFGSICPDAYGIGYATIEQLVLSLDGSPIQPVTAVDLIEIEAGNVSAYMNDSGAQ